MKNKIRDKKTLSTSIIYKRIILPQENQRGDGRVVKCDGLKKNLSDERER